MKKASKRSKADIPPKVKAKDDKSDGSVEKANPNYDEGRIDYGGLPDRDLKKNLGGCG